MSTIDVWHEIIEGPLAKAIPTLLLVAMLGLVVLLSSVPCESGFSLLGIIKTKLRNRLNIEHLCDLMQVAKNSPDRNSVAFKVFLEAAYEHWMSEVVRKNACMCMCVHVHTSMRECVHA